MKTRVNARYSTPVICLKSKPVNTSFAGFFACPKRHLVFIWTLQARKDAAEAAKPTVNTPEQAKELERQALEKNPITKLSPEQAKAIDEQSKSTVHTSAEAKELEDKILGKVNNKSVDIQEKTVYDEYKLNRMKIQETLHNVEEKRRTLDYEVGTIIDREDNVVEEIGGEAHSVSVNRNMEDMIFTHNHPSGGCFSGGDIYSMLDDKLLELRASTPQGTYFSLLRTSKSTFDTTFADEYKEAISYKNAIKAVTEDLKSGIISKEDVKSRGFALYVEYMSKAGEVYLTENAERFGYIYSKGVI